MPVQKLNINANRGPATDDDEIDFAAIIFSYLKFWPLFIVSVGIALCVAYVFVRLAKPVYEIKATIMMDDNQENTPGDKTILQQLDLTDQPKVLENEIEVLQSRHLVEQVVNDLELFVSYSRKNKSGIQDLYGTTPIRIQFIKRPADLGNQAIKVEVKDEATYILKPLDSDPKTIPFNDTITNEAGVWRLFPTYNLQTFVGSTIDISLQDMNTVIDNYQAALDVSVKEKGSIVDITFKDPIAQRGKDFVNRLIQFYNQAQMAEKKATIKSTLDFINKRLDSLTYQLNHAEGKVENFRSVRGITDIGSQSQAYLQSEQTNDAKLNDVRVQLNVINNIEDYINAANDDSKRVPSTLNIADPNLVNLVNIFEQEQQERTRLLVTTPEKNPVFDQLNKQIANTRAAIKENVKNIKSSLLATQGQLQSVSNKVKSTIAQVPGEDRQLTDMKRQQLAVENLYNYMLQKKEEVALSYESTLPNSHLVDAAYVLPQKGSKKLVPFAAAFAVGLLIPVGLIFGLNTVRNKITTARQIESGTLLPVKAVLKQTKLKQPIVFDADNEGAGGSPVEQFRGLRAQLHYLHHDDGNGKVTLIASGMGGEGKTFVAANLAVALAASGKKTILIELNVYKPALSALFGLPAEHAGMTNYLNWTSLKEDVVQSLPTYRNLDVITGGPQVNNFSELLDRKRTEVLFEWLRLSYDHIVVDTAPMQDISDVNIVARLCDVTLFVVRYNFTSKKMLAHIKKLAEEKQLPKMNMIFNGVEHSV